MILVTGANGQLGTSLRKLYPAAGLFLTSAELDITQSTQIEKAINNNKISHIINCAAYTNVEKAESEPEKAFAVNETGPRNLAIISEKYSIPLIHISTDYVFDGAGNLPYQETDQTNPINIYGKSKLAGEKAILDNANNAAIIRTSWLYSTSKDNFVEKVITLLKTKPEINIVYDQVGTPTFSDDLAACIMNMIAKMSFNETKIFHYSNEGVVSWYDFACAIAKMTGISTPINPVRSAKFPTVAARPPFTVLSKEKIKNTLDIKIKHWTESLETCLSQKQY